MLSEESIPCAILQNALTPRMPFLTGLVKVVMFNVSDSSKSNSRQTRGFSRCRKGLILKQKQFNSKNPRMGRVSFLSIFTLLSP
jgi:hypothetical protein